MVFVGSSYSTSDEVMNRREPSPPKAQFAVALGILIRPRTCPCGATTNIPPGPVRNIRPAASTAMLLVPWVASKIPPEQGGGRHYSITSSVKHKKGKRSDAGLAVRAAMTASLILSSPPETTQHPPFTGASAQGNHSINQTLPSSSHVVFETRVVEKASEVLWQ